MCTNMNDDKLQLIADKLTDNAMEQNFGQEL